MVFSVVLLWLWQSVTTGDAVSTPIMTAQPFKPQPVSELERLLSVPAAGVPNLRRPETVSVCSQFLHLYALCNEFLFVDCQADKLTVVVSWCEGACRTLGISL
jgi:hypothetical protein